MGYFSGYICDECGVMEYIDTATKSPYNKKTLVDSARRNGWSIGKEKIVCPNCRKEKRMKKMPSSKIER